MSPTFSSPHSRPIWNLVSLIGPALFACGRTVSRRSQRATASEQCHDSSSFGSNGGSNDYSMKSDDSPMGGRRSILKKGSFADLTVHVSEATEQLFVSSCTPQQRGNHRDDEVEYEEEEEEELPKRYRQEDEHWDVRQQQGEDFTLSTNGVLASSQRSSRRAARVKLRRKAVASAWI